MGRGDDDQRGTGAALSDESLGGAVAGEDTVVKDTVAVAVFTLLSRISGFARVVMIAAALGVNRFSDLYQSLNLLPNYTHELLTGTLITALLVPQLVRHLDVGDRASMGRLAGGFLSIVALAASVVVVAVTAIGFLVVRALTLGVDDPETQAELVRLGWPLLALLMPQVVFYATAATGAAVQNASGRFVLPAMAPIIENLVIIAVLGLWAGFYGRGIDSIAGIGTDQVLFLGLGTTTAVFLHALLQWWGAGRCGVWILPRLGWRDEEVRSVVRLALPSVGYTALNTARLVAFLMAAGLVTGGQTVFLIALNFFFLPVAITCRPLATTALPVLSRLRLRPDAFAERFLSSVSVMFFLAVPAAALMSGLARPIASIGLWGPAATDAAVTLLAASIAAVALAVPGESLFVLSTSASYAKLDARSPLRAMAIRLAVSVSLTGLIGLVNYRSDVEGWTILAALGLAMAIGDASGAGYLAQRVLAGAGGLVKTVAPRVLSGLVVLAAAVAIALAVDALLGSGRLAASVAIAVASALTLAIGLVALRISDEDVLSNFVKSDRLDGLLGVRR